MRKSLSLILALAMLANGCAGVRVVDPNAPGEVLRELNADAEGRVVRVELLSGQTFSGTSIHAASDSTTWFDAGDRRVVVSTAEIAKVDVVGWRSANRAGRGALIGAIPGGIMFLSYGLSDESDDSGLAGLFCGVVLVGGALLGAAVGLASAREKEMTTTYVLDEASAGFLLEDAP
ncbi:hypothetical protein KAW64_13270 [bacterium]|nr:hypothetical protein [bacterium]